MNSKLLPEVIGRGSKQRGENGHDSENGQASGRERSPSELWIRLSAFMSMRSEETQKTYMAIVREWCEFLGAPMGSEKAARLVISAEDIHAMAYKKWLEGRAGQKPRLKESITVSSERRLLNTKGRRQPKRDGLQSTMANATIVKKFAALRRIYRMILDCNLGASQNPFSTDRVPPPSRTSGQKRPTEMIDFSLVKQIVESPDSTSPKGLRDKAILALLFGAGLRRSEVAAIRFGDVKKTLKGTTYVVLRATKGKRDANQALPGWAAKIVMDVVAARKKDGASPGDYLLVSYRGPAGKTATRAHVSTNGLYRLFKHYCILAGAGPHVSPHSARATAITKLLSEGIPYREVQEFSRHASVQMVEGYDKRRIGIDQNPAKDLDYE